MMSTLESNFMLIVFFMLGFVSYFEAKPAGETARVDLTPIQSPNYPNNYDDYTDETFHRSVEEGSLILITFTDFHLESHQSCGFDWVKIVDGDGTVLLDKSCGSDKPDPITSKTNRISVEFHSDDTRTGRGFKAEWKAVTGGSSGCKCGIPNRVQRIVNGTNTEVNEYPWQVRTGTKQDNKGWKSS